MEAVVFYEKPGCIGNEAQKTLLRNAGLQLQVKSLLDTDWTAGVLRAFFNDTPVNQWFNLSAPQVKSGDIDIEQLNEQQAIKLMLAEPLLICRPLLRYGDIRQAGFVPGPVLAALNFTLDADKDLQSCPMTEDPSACGESV